MGYILKSFGNYSPYRWVLFLNPLEIILHSVRFYFQILWNWFLILAEFIYYFAGAAGATGAFRAGVAGACVALLVAAPCVPCAG